MEPLALVGMGLAAYGLTILVGLALLALMFLPVIVFLWLLTVGLPRLLRRS